VKGCHPVLYTNIHEMQCAVLSFPLKFRILVTVVVNVKKSSTASSRVKQRSTLKLVLSTHMIYLQYSNKKVSYLPVAGFPTYDCISSPFDPYFFKYSSSSFSAKSDLLKYFLDDCYKED
jgi:hypothetical protein